MGKVTSVAVSAKDNSGGLVLTDLCAKSFESILSPAVHAVCSRCHDYAHLIEGETEVAQRGEPAHLSSLS